jgi:hypothetical protein
MQVQAQDNGLQNSVEIDRAIGCNPASSKPFDPAPSVLAYPKQGRNHLWIMCHAG